MVNQNSPRSNPYMGGNDGFPDNNTVLKTISTQKEPIMCCRCVPMNKAVYLIFLY